MKAVLAARLAVATAGIATGFGENRHDLVSKVDGRNIFEFFDGHRERGGHVACSLATSDGERVGVRGS